MTVNRSDFRMVTAVDDDPDLSYLGEYTRNPTAASIDRARRGKLSTMQLRYWTPASPEYAEQDYARAEAYNAGDWHMVRVAATVQLAIPVGTTVVLHRITTPGLYGVESDSGDGYMATVYTDECQTLATMLGGMGITVLDDREGVSHAV